MAGGKNGVGLYVNAGHAVAARRLDLVSSTPGFKAAIYGAPDGVPSRHRRLDARLSATGTGRGAALPARHGGQRFRYYLRLDHEAAGGRARRRIQELGLEGCHELTVLATRRPA